MTRGIYASFLTHHHAGAFLLYSKIRNFLQSMYTRSCVTRKFYALNCGTFFNFKIGKVEIQSLYDR